MKGLYVAIFAATLLLPLSASAHGPVERESEADTGVSRIFTADAATGEVIAIDLDDAQSVQRLSTPPYIMVLGLSQDRKHLFAMRGRDTQRDFVTVIDTGFDPDSEEVLPPHVARTFPGSAPTTGGLHHGKSAVINGRDAIFMEGTGELVLFEEKSFDSLSEVSTKRIKLAAPDHYHHVISEGRLYNGYIRGGFVQVIDLETGDEVTRIDGCPRLHGMALDEESGRSFWACGDDILVIGTRGDEANSVIARLPYPTEQRVGTFMQGKGGILWGATEGTLAYLYRIDLKADPRRCVRDPGWRDRRHCQATARHPALRERFP